MLPHLMITVLMRVMRHCNLRQVQGTWNLELVDKYMVPEVLVDPQTVAMVVVVEMQSF